jgi:hypothetical protein
MSTKQQTKSGTSNRNQMIQLSGARSSKLQIDCAGVPLEIGNRSAELYHRLKRKARLYHDLACLTNKTQLQRRPGVDG